MFPFYQLHIFTQIFMSEGFQLLELSCDDGGRRRGELLIVYHEGHYSPGEEMLHSQTQVSVLSKIEKVVHPSP